MAVWHEPDAELRRKAVNWEMVPAGGGEVARAGLEVLVLDKDGRITTDYQFIES